MARVPVGVLRRRAKELRLEKDADALGIDVLVFSPGMSTGRPAGGRLPLQPGQVDQNPLPAARGGVQPYLHCPRPSGGQAGRSPGQESGVQQGNLV